MQGGLIYLWNKPSSYVHCLEHGRDRDILIALWPCQPQDLRRSARLQCTPPGPATWPSYRSGQHGPRRRMLLILIQNSPLTFRFKVVFGCLNKALLECCEALSELFLLRSTASAYYNKCVIYSRLGYWTGNEADRSTLGFCKKMRVYDLSYVLVHVWVSMRFFFFSFHYGYVLFSFTLLSLLLREQ